MKASSDIKKRIKQSKPKHDLNLQRAELLKRNKTFLSELENIKNKLGKEFFDLSSSIDLDDLSEDNILLKINWPPEKIKNDLKPPYYDAFDEPNFLECESTFLNTVHGYKDLKEPMRTLRAKMEVLHRYVRGWRKFCGSWCLDFTWDGELSSLSKFMGPPVIALLDDYDYYLCEDNLLPICIRISAWSSIADIKNLWPEIDVLQKKLRGGLLAKTQNFDRDLRWYDLNKKEGMSPGKIAKYWIGNHPQEIDILVMKSTKRDSDSREELNEENAVGLLNEIRTDPAMADLKRQFEYHRRNYIEGPHSPFIDLIKKTIKNMETKINGPKKPSLLKRLV